MAKRKRELEPAQNTAKKSDNQNPKVTKTNGHIDVKTTDTVIQIVVGSYERVLHGISASISNLHTPDPQVEFADSFLFNAHASAIRCLALSPLPAPDASDARGVYLATGGSDERVNVYSLSVSPLPSNSKIPVMPTMGNKKISENPGNRELGTLMQHSSNITSLHFPTRAKLLSSSEDNTLAITRLRDLTTVSTIKAPRPKVQGQPSGDTAPLGTTPAGINDFATHPSMKLMISVGRGERSMRLWNLVTGKKAGVLNFGRHLLQMVKEGKYSSGEGRKIRWNGEGTEFAVSFERGIVVFGEDSRPKCVALPQPLTKVHQMTYFSTKDEHSYLTLSTEDGRLIFYDTFVANTGEEQQIPSVQPVAQLGGQSAGVSGRVKDFKILSLSSESEQDKDTVIIITASSDGIIRVWSIKESDLRREKEIDSATNPHNQQNQVGSLLESYETGNRITCLDAFIMLPATEGDELGLSEFEGLTEAEEENDSESDSDDSD